MDKTPTNKDDERAKAVKELQNLQELNAQDVKFQSAMIDELEKSGAITKEKADELRKIGGILNDEENTKTGVDTKTTEPEKKTKVKYSEAEKARQFVNLSTNISSEKNKIIDAINKTGTFRYGKLKKLKDVLYRLEFIEDSINSDNQNEVPRIGVSLIENLPDDFDKKSLHKLGELFSEYEELLLSKKDNEQEDETPDTENKDGVANLEKIEAEIRAIKKDNDFIKNTKEALIAKGCPKMEAQTMATCEEAINRAQAKTNILIKNPEAKDAESRLKELEKIIEDNSAKLSELRLKNNIEETKVDEVKPDNKETAKTDTEETKTEDTTTNPEPKQMSPEEIASLERLLYTAEAKASIQLESSKFKNGIIKGLSKWEKFGQGEEGAKGFIKRYTKTAINLALIGVISSLSVQKLAENGIGTATALGGSVTTALTKKMAMGLGFGGIMEMAPEKAKKWLTVGVGLGSVALATVLTGGGAGVMAAGSFIVGYGAQKFINGKFTDEKIAEKEEKAKAKFLEKVKLENTSIDEDKLKEIEAQYSKILKKYENQRIWGKMADGISKLTVGSLISGLTMEASGRINDNLHHQTSDISTRNEGLITETKDSIVTQDHNGIVVEQNDSIAKPDTTSTHSVVATEEIKADSIKHEEVITATKDSTVVSSDTIKHEDPIVAVKDSTINAQDSIKETAHINSGNEIKADSIKHEDATAAGAPTAKVETEIKLTEEQLKNVIIQKGEGIEHSFIRQIENDHKLAEDLGYKGDINDEKALHAFAGRQAHVLAIKEGYVEVGDNGEMKEVRISEAGKVGHLIKMEDGHATVTEVTAEGKVLEIHHEGDKFESEPDKHEYIKGGSSTESSEKITETSHIGQDGKVVVASGEEIVQTPHITSGSDMTYNEDPATYLGHHDAITPTDHVEPGKGEQIIDNKNIDQHYTKPEDTSNDNVQKEESLAHELTNKELRQIERIHDHNIHKIFPNNYEEQNWHDVKNMDANKLYHLKINEISEEYKQLHHYIHKLSVITGFESLPGDSFHEPETKDHFIREALKEAARLGKMDQVKL